VLYTLRNISVFVFGVRNFIGSAAEVACLIRFTISELRRDFFVPLSVCSVDSGEGEGGHKCSSVVE
jgi:hypothetical protein